VPAEDTYRQYSWPVSPYSAKTRSYLQYKNIPHELITVNVLTMKRSIEKKLGFMIMPVIIGPNDEVLQDSAIIIDTLEERFAQPSIIPDGPTQNLISNLIELHADEWMTIIAMHTRWNTPQNARFAQREFGKYSLPFLPSFTHPRIGKIIAKKMASYLPILGVTSATAPAIEAWLKELLAALDQHFAEHTYLLGGRACRGDFALYGPLQAHVQRDPGSRHFIDAHPNVDAWIKRLTNAQHTEPSEFLANDEIPSTLRPLIKRIFTEQFPALQETVSRIENWCEANPGQEKIPRSLGMLEFQLGERSEKRKALVFGVWKLQRVLDQYQALDSKPRKAVDEYLDQVDGLEAMQINIKHRLIRKNYRIRVDLRRNQSNP